MNGVVFVMVVMVEQGHLPAPLLLIGEFEPAEKFVRVRPEFRW
jgi:hypothetical protein